MAKQLAESRAALDQQRQGVQDDARFGPTVTQRFAAGVGLLEFKVGWYNPTAGWLRVRGTPDGQLVFTTEEAHAIAYYSSATCTAFLISADGWIVTNRHCVDGAGEEARTLKLAGAEFRPTISFWRIAFPKGKFFAIDPRSMRYSTEHDVALLRLSAQPQGVPVIPLASGDSVVAGEDVVLLSYPGGTGITMVRAGVSAKVVDEAADSATAAFIRGAAVDGYINRLPQDEKQFEEALKKHVDLQVLYQTIGAIRGGAAFDAVARAGHLQPDVSARMNVSGVRPDAISYHALGGVAGSSGAPLIGPKLSVVGVNFAGFGRQINGKQYQHSDAVPVSYVLRLVKRP
jgi:S1-C subfamily serine protease